MKDNWEISLLQTLDSPLHNTVNSLHCGYVMKMSGAITRAFSSLLCVYCPGYSIMALYTIHMLDVCQSSDTGKLQEIKGNKSLADSYLELNLSISDHQPSTETILTNESNIMNISMLTNLPDSHNSSFINSANISSDGSQGYEPRTIYIRGHLLRHVVPRTKKVYSLASSSTQGLLQDPKSGQAPSQENDKLRQKQKHTDEKAEPIYNNILHDIIEVDGDSNRQRTEFYAWIFGASMLSVAVLTTVISCVLFCVYREHKKTQQSNQTRPLHARTGVYQRVGSVSSVVDNGIEPLDTIYEESTETDTVI